MTEDIQSHNTSKVCFGLRKILNDCSAEQETVGATLRMTTKTTAGFIAEKNWIR